MITVKGKVENGQILALEPLDEEFEGHEVSIALSIRVEPESGDDWQELFDSMERNSIETGIGDLAHQHDHYLYGLPKRD